MKKIIHYSISIAINIIIAVVFYELILQIIPVIYRNLPVANDKIYVYVLGESSAWGQPYQSKISYSKIIGYMLNSKLDGKEMEFKIFASPGSSLTEQYKKYFIYKYLHPFRKGIVLLYIGTNNWSNKDNYTGYDRFLKFIIADLINTYFKNVDDFKYEYEKILLLSKKFGDDAYASTIAGNYAGFMPNNVVSLVYNPPLKEKIDKIDDLIFHGSYDDAIKQCNELLKTNEDKSQILYRIGKIYEKQGKIKDANEAFLHAVDFEWDARPTRYQNNVILNLAAKYNVPVTDIFKKLYDSNEIIGYNFFADKIHPSVKLNSFIAEGFVGLLAGKYNADIINKDLSDEKILRVFGFTKEDLFFQYAESIREVFMYSYIDGIICRYNFDIMEKYICDMKKLNIDVYENKQYITLCEMLFHHLRGDNIDINELLNVNESLKSKFPDKKLHFDIFYNWIKKRIKK